MSTQTKSIGTPIDVLDARNGNPVQYRSTVSFPQPEASRITTKHIDQSSIDIASYSTISKIFYISFSNQYDKAKLKEIIKAFADSIGADVLI